MTRHTSIKPAPTVTELLTAIVNAKRLIDASGDLGNAPTDLLNALDAGDDAARELLEWLGEQVPQRPMTWAEFVS